MENGTYDFALEMTTPLGRRRGSLALTVLGNTLKGSLTMFTRTLPIREGARKGNNIFFRGDMKTFMKIIPYQAEGEIRDRRIVMTIDSDLGRYAVQGNLTKRG
ncbi:MAG: hypothetical protein ACI4P4_03355 [Faecousia sp.]